MSLAMHARLGPYEILAPLGAGGMGEVYKARDTRLNRFVALKVLPADMVSNPERKRRFIQEAQAASALNHPNIITIHDIGSEGGVDFMVMEFVAGKTVAELISSQPMQTADAVKYATQVADALSAAHGAGIVHRDLKPANVMVSDAGLVKVLDFGLAKLQQEARSPAAETETELGVVMGTASYMSPEQVEGKRVDARSDIFSFGLVLYEMLSGRRAFTAGTAIATMAAILHAEAPPLVAPTHLGRVVSRCLRKDAAERYQSASELKTALTATPAGPPEPAPSIAVLPFVNMNRDQENEFLSDGITEDIINALMKVEGLRVAARSSAFQFKGKSTEVNEVGQKLKVECVLEGSVRRSGERLRIGVQLINAADGFQLWSERYDRVMQDIFDVQDEISQAIVEKLKVKLVGERLVKRHTADPVAYQTYLMGRHHWHRRTPAGFKLARVHFEEAIARDPEFALPYVGLADCLLASGFYGAISTKEVIEQADRLLDKALEIDDTLAEAYASRGYLLGCFKWDSKAAEAVCRRAIELNPNCEMAHFAYATFALTLMGRFQEAYREANITLTLDPHKPLHHGTLAFVAVCERNYEAALEYLARGLQVDPDYPVLLSLEAVVLFHTGHREQAIEKMERASRFLAPGGLWGPGQLGHFYGRTGREMEARRVLREMEALRISAYAEAAAIAAVHAGLGEFDKAFEWLEIARQEHSGRLSMIKVEPVWDVLRDDPRFAALLDRMKAV